MSIFWHHHFRLEIEGSGKTWKQDQRIRLQHVDTGGYLHSHDKKYSRIAGGQQEVKINSDPYFSILHYSFYTFTLIQFFGNNYRFVVSEKSVQIMFGWQQKEYTFRLLKANRTSHPGFM
uniref:MIR domain-containing protein n=1 Tax=Nelumbo nucifera TaxID=4432 RepID=A0A822Y4M0_NELNU|nr:TPA_asm: hypothetical protein HUJ06_028855 [Nelumbo nucifera]